MSVYVGIDVHRKRSQVAVVTVTVHPPSQNRRGRPRRHMIRRRSSASSSYVLARSYLVGCGHSNWTLSHTTACLAGYQERPNNSDHRHPQRHAYGRRASHAHPLDTRGPHGCRSAVAFHVSIY